MLPDINRCECVIWRDGSRRCELWSVLGGTRLRVYDSDDLLLEEPFEGGTGWDRALALRADCGARPRALSRSS